jgi:hypothetical protein
MREHSRTTGHASRTSLTERAARYLSVCDPAISGAGGHNTTFRLACTLLHGFCLSPIEAFRLLKVYNERCQPPWSDSELRHKILSAANADSAKGHGYLLNADIASLASSPASELVSPAPISKWPAPDLDAIDAIVRSGLHCYDVWESSPVRFETDALREPSHTEEIIDAVFPGDPFLCCGWASWGFATRRRSVWSGQLSEMPLMVPNPMVVPFGRTKEGRRSQHALASVGHRIYLVIEFDFAETDRSGKPALWAPLIRGWTVDRILLLDACAALSAHLSTLLPSWLLFLSSGGKSGHSWFNVRGLPICAQRAFFIEAVGLGADPQLWTRSQFVRLPDGRRQNGRRQTVFYFNPQNAIVP